VVGERKWGQRETYDCWKLKLPAKHSLNNISIKDNTWILNEKKKIYCKDNDIN
jgi:hypothetical protein